MRNDQIILERPLRLEEGQARRAAIERYDNNPDLYNRLTETPERQTYLQMMQETEAFVGIAEGVVNLAIAGIALARAGRALRAAAPLTQAQRQIRDTLLREHRDLNPIVASEAARSGVRAAGPGGAGADVILANTVGREVSVHSGQLSNLGSHIAAEASQVAQGGQIFVQINTAGATQEQVLALLLGPNGFRNTPGLASGRTVRVFGPNGESWWTGVFR